MADVPKWHLEIDRFKTFKTTFLLEGNIFDLQFYKEENGSDINWIPCKLEEYLHMYLQSAGYGSIIFYNHVDGFGNDYNVKALDAFLTIARTSPEVNSPSSGTLSKTSTGSVQAPQKHFVALNPAMEMIRTFLTNREGSAKVAILNLASRYISQPDNLEDNEREFYSRLFLATAKPVQIATDKGFLNNLLLIIANKANDIPPWFYIDNPYLKIVQIAKPDRQTRQRFVDTQLSSFLGEDDGNVMTAEDVGRHKEKFIDLTDGMTNLDLNGLRVLCKQEGIQITKINEAITIYKYGIRENPWDSKDVHTKLDTAREEIQKRVKGQDNAIIQSLDIIKRAATGLAGLPHSSGTSKPKGILFFAGPTGVGKTELAKTLASLLFGDDNACIRFDMSEYGQEQSDQRLLGAPPGYVGYEAGGQLTNAVKERPFSILLFDEIEKAHPTIFDKFLQILEDGRMTDGQGETVYFSESIIIFTSNLGIYTTTWRGGQRTREANVTMEMAKSKGYDWLKETILKAIKDYFVFELGRPEILNRIGNNFVVFDYIQEDIVRQIVDGQINKICTNLRETKKMNLQIKEPARTFILGKATENRNNGGRGIGNAVETYFINPLARYLFDNKVIGNCTLTVNDIATVGDSPNLNCEVSHV